MDILFTAVLIRVILGFFIVSLTGFVFWISSVVLAPPIGLSDFLIGLIPVLAFATGSALTSWVVWLRRRLTALEALGMLVANLAVTLLLTWVGRDYLHGTLISGEWGGGLPGIHDLAGAWIGAAGGALILPVVRIVLDARKHREL